MKYANQHAVTTFALIAIVPMLLTVPLPAGAVEIHGYQTGAHNVSLGPGALRKNTYGISNTAIGTGALLENTKGRSNTAIGQAALHRNTKGNDNTAMGRGALINNTEGSQNTAMGMNALLQNTVSGSTAVGAEALRENTSGKGNVALGFNALTSNTIANFNSAVGYQALEKNVTGASNTALGYVALGKNNNGHQNTAIGYEALKENTAGRTNTAVGGSALRRNRTGQLNTAVGAQALSSINGHRNTALGYRAGNMSRSGNSNVFIGFQAGNNASYRNQSNKLVIANGRTLNDELISGSFQEKVVDINGQLNVQGELTTAGDASIGGTLNAQAVAMTSDGRLKKDIQPLAHALDAILQLEGKTYRWKEDTTFANKQDIGLVAQDVEKVFPELVAENEQGYKGIAYPKLTAVLIEAIKEQQNQITTLQQENQQLKSAMVEQMQALLARVAMLEGASLMAAN